MGGMTMSQFDQSITLPSGVQLKNRLMLSPMTTQLSFFNGVITEDEITYYKQRSKGLGAVITGAANVQDIGKGWPGELSIAHDEMIPRLSELAEAIQGEGAKAIIQIFHGGRMTSRATLSGEQPVSASAVAAKRPDAETPRAMSEEEIVETIQALTTVFSAVEQYAKKPFIVGYRFSPEEYETPGIRFEDTIWLLERLRESKLDYLHVSLNMYDRIARSDKYNDKSILEVVHNTIQGKIPLVGVGGIRNREDVEQVLKYAELAAIGQQMIVDPDWAEKLLENREDEFVTKPFEEAYKELYLPSPLYNFLKARYQ